MAEALENQIKRAAIEERIAKDPLTPEAERRKRNLILFSSICIIIVVFGVNADFYPLDVMKANGLEQRFNILGVMAFVLLFLYLSYAFHALTDVKAWYQLGDLIDLWETRHVVDGMRTQLDGLEELLEKARNDLVVDPDEVARFCRNMLGVSQPISSWLKTYRYRHNYLTRLIWIRIVSFDIVIPFLLGIYAMLNMSPYISFAIETVVNNVSTIL